LFEVLSEISEKNSITDSAFEDDDVDVSELSLPNLCMQDTSIKYILESKPEGVWP
jgi:hypothetical protein